VRQVDRLLEALRSVGPDQYRADPDHPNVWHSYCASCASHILEVRRLTITEDRDGRVRMICSTGCSLDSIFHALRIAELYPNAWCRRLRDEGRLAEQELEQLRRNRWLIRTIQREMR
jgi:hypothetical protein